MFCFKFDVFECFWIWSPLRLLFTPERSHLPEGDAGAAPWRRGVVHRTNRPSGQRAVPETPLQDGTCLFRVTSDIIYPTSTSTGSLYFFCLRVCVQQYPDYYAIIKEPIDLKIIAQKIQVCLFSSQYHSIFFILVIKLSDKCRLSSWATTAALAPWLKTWSCWLKMPRLTTSPAHRCSRWVPLWDYCARCWPTDDGCVCDALVSQDANTIKKIFALKKSEMEHGEPTKSSIRIR